MAWMEAEWLELAKSGKTVDVEMKVLYGDPGNINRPTKIEVVFKIDGVLQEGLKFNNGR